MGKRPRPVRPGFKLIQAYIPEPAYDLFKVAVAIRKQSMTRAIEQLVSEYTAATPFPVPPAPPGNAKPPKR